MARWKPSKSKAREFARLMDEIREYCDEHGISYSTSMDSYYFTVDGERYRVSNHTQAASDRGMYGFDVFTGEYGQRRESYHRRQDGSFEYDRDHEITASKTRIIEIYEALVAGKKLDKRGNVIG